MSKSVHAQKLQKIFEDLIKRETRPVELQGVGRKPGKPKRTHIVGATVADITQVNPTDGGLLTNPGFPIFSTITMDDVNQGQLSDCYALAFWAAMANTTNGRAYLQNVTIQKDPAAPDTRAIVSFFRNGTKTQIHCDLLVSAQFNHFDPVNQDLWVELLEKCYALFRTGADSYSSLNFGYSSAVASDMGLLPCGFISLVQSTVFNTIRTNLANQVPTTVGTPASPGYGLVGSHEYTVIGIDTSNNVTLRNPWGNTAGIKYTTLTPDQFFTATHANIAWVEYGTIPAAPVVVVPAPVPTPTPTPTPTPVPVVPSVTLKALANIPTLPGKALANNVMRMDGSLRLESNTTDGTGDIGYIAKDDQAFFLLNNPTARTSTLTFMCATPYQSAAFDVYVGTTKVGSVTAPGTSAWNKYVPCVLSNVALPAGLIGLTLVFTTANLNVNNVTVS